MKEIDFSPAKISEAEKNRLLIKAVNDRPNAATSYGKAKLNSTETKDIFDKPFEMSVERHNALVDKVIELQAEVSDAIEKHASAVAVEIERQDGEIEAIRGVADDANIYAKQAHMFASDAVLEAEAAKQRSEAAIEAVGKIDTALDSIIAIQEELIGTGDTGNDSNLITFTFNGEEYTAEEGMTWEEFIDSEYNTVPFLSGNSMGEYVGTLYWGINLVYLEGAPVGSDINVTETIVANGRYAV